MIDIGHLIALLGLLCAIVLPIAVVLFNDIGRGLKLDRQLIIGKIFDLPTFISAAILMCIFIFVAIILPSDRTGYIQLFLILYAAIYFVIIFAILIASMRWLNSDDYSSSTRNSYKEERRLKYLTSRDLKSTVLLWREFWTDEKTYQYLGEQHLYPYIEAFLAYVASLKPKHQAYAVELFRDFRIAFLKLAELHSYTVEFQLLPSLLQYFERSCMNGDYQQELWAGLIDMYLHVVYLQETQSLFDYLEYENRDDKDKDDDFLNIPNPSRWRMMFDVDLTSGSKITNEFAIYKLAETICAFYQKSIIKSLNEHIQYLCGMQKINSGENKKFYGKLISALRKNDSAILAKYLIKRAEHCKKAFD